jgi:hypothetical protein
LSLSRAAFRAAFMRPTKRVSLKASHRLILDPSREFSSRLFR